jgi:transcriptional regulator with XRE-family HTH domain
VNKQDDIASNTIFGWRVRQERDWTKMSLEELSAQSGISRRRLLEIEAGAGGMDSIQVRKLAGIFGCSISSLFSYSRYLLLQGQHLYDEPQREMLRWGLDKLEDIVFIRRETERLESSGSASSSS